MGQLMELLASDLKLLPREPSRTKERRNKPSPGLVSFAKDNPETGVKSRLSTEMSPEQREYYGLKLVTTDYLTDHERDELATDPWSAQVVERFRRRFAVSESSVARFAIAGATDLHGGRHPESLKS